MSTQAIRAGRAFVELFADDSALVRNLKAAEKKIEAWGKAVSSLGKNLMKGGLAVTAPMFAATKLFGDQARELSHAAERTGIPVDQLSALAYAARKGGADMESLETGIRKMSKAIVQAAEGTPTAVEALKHLGLTVKDLAALSPDEQFKLIADRLGKVENPTLRAATALELFGRSGTSILPMAELGAKGIDALIGRAKELGLVMSREEVAAGKTFAGGLSDLYQQLRRVTDAIGYALANAINPLMPGFQRAGRALIDFVRDHQQAVVNIFALSSAVVAAGVALFAFSKALMLAGTAIHGLVVMVHLGYTTIMVTCSAVSALAGAVTFLCTPMGLLIAAVAAVGLAFQALTVYLVATSKTGQAVIAWLADQFSQLAAFVGETFAAIGNALAAGDLAAAAEVAWAAMRVVWQSGVYWLYEKWQQMRMGWTDLHHDLAAVLIWFWSRVQTVWYGVTTLIAQKLLDLAALVGIYDQEIAERAKGILAADFVGRQVGRELKLSDTLRANEEDRMAEQRKLFDELDSSRKTRDDAWVNWRKAVDKAKSAKAEIPKFDVKAPGVPELDLAALAKERVLTAGTLSGEAVSRLGMGGGLEEVAKQIRDINAEQLKLEQEAFRRNPAQSAGAVFSL